MWLSVYTIFAKIFLVIFDFADIITFTTVFELLFFILYILFKSFKPYHNKVLAIFFLTQMLGIVYWMLEKHELNTPIVQILDVFTLLWAPSLYLYAQALTKKKSKPNIYDLIHSSPFILFFLYTIVRVTFNLPKISFNIIVSAQVIIYNLVGIYILITYHRKVKNNFSTDESIIRKWVAIALIGYTIACFFPYLPYLLGFLENTSSVVKSVIAFLPFLIFFNILFLNAIENPVVIHELPKEERYKGSSLTENMAQEYLKKLDILVNEKHCFLEPELTLGDLSEMSGIPSRYLSQIINQYKNKSFFDYINGLRVNYACNLLLTDNRKNILEILYESGFNSKTSFNTSFKKHTGLSPSEYKAKFKKDTSNK